MTTGAAETGCATQTIDLWINYYGLGTRRVPVECLTLYDPTDLTAASLAARLHGMPDALHALFVVGRSDRALPWTGAALRYREAPYRKHFIDLAGGFEAYLAGLGAKRRQELRRDLRHFTATAPDGVAWREYRAVAEAEAFFELASDVSARTPQQGRYRNAIGAGDAVVFRREAARGAFRGYVLFDQGRPVAYNHCQVVGDVLIGNMMGFAQDQRKHGPGNVLLYLMIEQLFRSGEFRRLDFGRGAFAYKAAFANGSMDCTEAFYFRPTPRNALLLAQAAAANTLSQAARRMVRRLRPGRDTRTAATKG